MDSYAFDFGGRGEVAVVVRDLFFFHVQGVIHAGLVKWEGV